MRQGKKEDLDWLRLPDEEKVGRRCLQKRREDFSREFPNMVLQLTLLLNAGLILDAAFDEILNGKQKDDGILFGLLCSLRDGCRRTNASFIRELYLLAGRSRDRDFIRFATLAAEHQGRGSELSDRLEREKDHLWAARLSAAKAAAKEAETKLCLPLMMLLIAIVIISIAPALMEMS